MKIRDLPTFIAAAVIAVSVSACGVLTGNPAVDFSPATIQANIATFNAWATKIAADANADVTALAQAGLPAVCTAVKVLDADLATAALVSSQAANAKPEADKVAQAFTSSAACTNPAGITNAAQAIADGVAAAKQIQTALKADPTVVAPTPVPAGALTPTS